ncbi:carboxylesterase/lipase family protein [Mycobacteroides abscessus]|nr:carboxylesterase family protein [Mycobacteroides abscessus]
MNAFGVCGRVIRCRHRSGRPLSRGRADRQLSRRKQGSESQVYQCDPWTDLNITATTAVGALRGVVEHEVVTFRGVPYAQADRFAQPRPIPPWEGERAATEDGPICPQLPSRLEAVMGKPELHEQLEDCLSLTITTPSADDAARPVLVWFHGGGFTTGAGSLRCYGGHRLTRDGNIVVVAVNYRVGIFGYLMAEGISAGNLATADHLAALQWVHANISAFGGDPHNVTIAGQSAGAHSVLCLLGMPSTRGLFTRAILQSGPAFLGIGSARMARHGGKRFLAHLNGDPRTASTAEILRAQEQMVLDSAGFLNLSPSSGLTTIPGVEPLPDNRQWADEIRMRANDLDIIIGTTGQEMSAFHRQNTAMKRLRKLPILGPLIASTIEHTLGEIIFGAPARRIARRLAKAGARVWIYKFDYRAPASTFGATHCIELPFLLGTDTDWEHAPMLAGAHSEDIAAIGQRTRAAWLSFIRSGAPVVTPAWQPYSPSTRSIYRLGSPDDR